MLKSDVIKICDATIHPGEKTVLALPLPELYSCSPMFMPIKVINGRNEGPCLVALSNLQGHEFIGLDILNQLYDLIDPNELSGCIIIVPVLNIYGLTHYPKITPSGAPIANCFPGNEHGSYGERIAHIFTKEILTKADYCIEFQTGSLNQEAFPHVYCNFDDKASLKIAKYFQAPVIMEVETSSSQLRVTTDSLNIPLLVYQAGEAMRFDAIAVQTGLTGIQNVLTKIDMLKGTIGDSVSPVISKDDDWLVASASGILHTEVNLGQRIKKGEKIGWLSDPFSNESKTVITSYLDGIIVGINRTPLIQEGISVFKIASFIDNARAESILEEWGEQSAQIEANL